MSGEITPNLARFRSPIWESAGEIRGYFAAQELSLIHIYRLEAEVIVGAQTYMEITEGGLAEVRIDENHLMLSLIHIYPPYPPTEHNYVGQYRRLFYVDKSWIGKQICLCIGSATSRAMRFSPALTYLVMSKRASSLLSSL